MYEKIVCIQNILDVFNINYTHNLFCTWSKVRFYLVNWHIFLQAHKLGIRFQTNRNTCFWFSDFFTALYYYYPVCTSGNKYSILLYYWFDEYDCFHHTHSFVNHYSHFNRYSFFINCNMYIFVKIFLENVSVGKKNAKLENPIIKEIL